jgi:hypothetical protein
MSVRALSTLCLVSRKNIFTYWENQNVCHQDQHIDLHVVIFYLAFVRLIQNLGRILAVVESLRFEAATPHF